MGFIDKIIKALQGGTLKKEKSIYEYKMFEPFEIDIAQANEERRRLNIQNGKNNADLCCVEIGNNSDFVFYKYQPDAYWSSDEHILRQTKSEPKNIVYFGEAKTYNCIYHDFLFKINGHSITGSNEHQIFLTNVYSGDTYYVNFFATGQVRFPTPDDIHFYCRDVVEEMYVTQDDHLIVEIKRYKDRGDYIDPDSVEGYYKLHIDYVDGDFIPSLYLNSK